MCVHQYFDRSSSNQATSSMATYHANWLRLHVQGSSSLAALTPADQRVSGHRLPEVFLGWPVLGFGLHMYRTCGRSSGASSLHTMANRNWYLYETRCLQGSSSPSPVVP